MKALQIFHVNINCSNLERSLAFYERIGFHQAIDFAPPGEGQALGEPQLGAGGAAEAAPAGHQGRALVRCVRPPPLRKGGKSQAIGNRALFL